MRWIPVLGWMAIIFVMSGREFDAKNSLGLLASILRSVAPGWVASLTAQDLDALNFALRKAGHVSEYFALCALAHFAIGRAPGRALKAVSLCAAYAVTDEVHQRFVPGRTAAAGDVVIDTFGALLAAAAVGAAGCMRRRKAAKQSPGT